MQAAAETLLKLGRDRKFIGGKLGILAVLHTSTRALEQHPHVHMLVPAGGLDQDGVWHYARKKFLVPIQALSAGVRGRFMKPARAALPEIVFPRSGTRSGSSSADRPSRRKN